MAKAPDPVTHMIDTLVAAGDHAGARAFALEAARLSTPAGGNPIEGGAAPGAPAATLAQQWKAAETEGRTLPLSHLKALTLDEMGDLSHNHKPLLEASLKNLKVGE